MFSELFVLAHGEVNQIPCFGYLSIVFHVLDIINCIPCFGYFVFHVLDILYSMFWIFVFHVLDIYQLSILMFTLL